MGLIDNKEMLKKAKFLNDRVIEIFITLSNREHEYKKETTWRSELSYYFLTLEKIQEHLVQFSKVYKDSNKKEEFIDFVLTPANIVNLPENFTVKNITKYFTPKLSPNQTVLLLSLLREEGVLPPYSDSSLGKLGETFFARNQKTITKGLTDIYSLKKNTEDITVLKSLLKDMLNKL